MQRTPSGILVFSPSDLVEFMESPFASWMSRYALDHPEAKPAAGGDPLGAEALLQRRGFEHERQVLAELEASGLSVAALDPDAADAREQTLAALRAGRDVVYQASLALPPFAGIADFLVRVPGASALGDFHYEVWDAKLARRAKPGHALQLCAYAEMLEAIQGVRAEAAQVALGGGGRERLRVDEFFYFYRALKQAFLAFMEAWTPDAPPAPDPSAEHRRWREAAERWLEEHDAVARVAFSTKQQARRLAAAGIETLSALADTPLQRVAGIEDRAFERLREQAALQRDSAGQAPPRYRVLREEEVEEGRGLALLPPPSPGDLVFDLEGDPLEEGGLEYLWGTACVGEDGAVAYSASWAHDARGERAALEAFLDALAARRARHPDLHVYHYGAYELSALKRLVAREETREEELDDLLRAGVFVDLYPIVRHGLRVGEPGYSLKNVERLVRPPRGGEVASGMESVAVYELWRESGEAHDAAASPLLEEIRFYNEEDCRSTLALLAWLRERQAEAGIAYRGAVRLRAGSEERRAEGDGARRRHELAARMRAAIPADPAARGEDRWRTQALLASLLEYHRREARPVWWDLFARAAMDEAERAEDLDCLAGLRRTRRARFPVKASWGYEYAFDPDQDTKIGVGSKCRIAQALDAQVEVEALDPDAGRIVLKISDRALAKAGLEDLPERACLILFEYRGTRAIEEAIEEIALRYDERGELPGALEDVLLRRPPRIRGHAGGSIRRPDEPMDAAFARAVRDLRGSALCVQGPPGSGKTTVAGRVIAQLLRGGAKVGITSHSHKAIVHLMTASAAAAGGRLDCVKIGGEAADGPFFDGARYDKTSGKAADYLAELSLIGGTAWCFSRPDLAGALDYLFVDEASQVPLANLVAMSRTARNLVLIGDPGQLDHPTRAAHPGESGLSALDYALAGHATLPPELGLFLEQTHRLHPDLCSFVSGAFYEGRLQPAPGNERRVLAGEPAAGIAFLPVPHDGNRQGSDEEVAAIQALLRTLLGRPRTRRDGTPAGRLAPGDVLVVAPYNLQVRKLRAALPPAVRVGTVDRFQGQEAPVVIVSMCASEPHLSARGIEFLFHPNRLNVALSRAETLAVVVGEPRLARAACRHLDEMRLVNRMCRLLEGAHRL